MATIKKVKPIQTKQVKADAKQEEYKKAAQVIQEERHSRELEFRAKLVELQEHYGIKLDSQIIISAL